MMLSELWLVRQWPTLASDWLLGSHGPRTNWPWQSPFPGQQRWQTQVLRSWANPDTLREGFLLSAQTPSKLIYDTHRGNHFGQISDTFSRRHKKINIFLKGVRASMLVYSFLSAASLVMEWCDLIKINSLHAYLCHSYLYTRRLVHI